MHRILVICLMLLFSSGSIFAQQPPTPEKMQKDMEKMSQERQKRQQEELERLKKENPQLYQQRKEALEKQEKINSILSYFREGRISASQAESQLYPLIREEIKAEMSGLESRIERLEKELEFLKKAKNNPDLLIKRRIDLMLGRIAPENRDVPPGATF